MRAVLQITDGVKCIVDKKIVSESQGLTLLILLGVGLDDSEKEIEILGNKIEKLRIFEDENHKMNNSIKDVSGNIFIVSQFTLYADTKKGNRPSFTSAMKPSEAILLYEKFIDFFRAKGFNVYTGIFGENMNLIFNNKGPVTICLDTNNY